MSIINGIKDFVGIDIGTNQLRAVQLKGTGDVRTLVRYAHMPIDANISSSDAAADRQKLGQYVKELMASGGFSTKNIAVGIPTNNVFTTTVDVDKLSSSEISQAIDLQVDSIIPNDVSESKIDWTVVGDSETNANKVEVLLSSVPNTYVESRLDILESIGLNVIAFEPNSLAIVRALLPPGGGGLVVIVNMGTRSTEIIVTLGGTPRLVRSIATGYDAVIKAAVQNLHIDEKQASQFVNKFGLSKEKLEGQVHGAIVGTIDALVSEVERSVKYVTTKYPSKQIERIIVSGSASTLPEFPLYIANKFGVSVEIGNSWRNVSFDATMQNDLLAISNRFAAAVGLAGRAE